MKQKYYETITLLRKEYTVQQLCKTFRVARSGYYAYLKRPLRLATDRDIQDSKAIQALYVASGGTYGAKKIAGTLKQEKGYIINHKRVARLMKEMNIQSKIRKVKTKKAEKDKSAGFVYENRLKRDFYALLPNKKWAMDVTEITIGTIKVYSSLYNREVLAFEMSYSPDLQLMEKTIESAMKYRDLEDLTDVVIHTDQGSLYRSFRYHQLSNKYHFIPSMSRKANCWDNAVIESFFSHLKTEFPYHFKVNTAEELIVA